jgi:hypothetical protein
MEQKLTAGHTDDSWNKKNVPDVLRDTVWKLKMRKGADGCQRRDGARRAEIEKVRGKANTIYADSTYNR